MKILVVAALKIEQHTITKVIERENELHEEPISLLKKAKIYNNKTEEEIEVALLDLEQVGNVEAGIKTYRALSFFKPELVILTGICGGFKKQGNLKLGDIVIPDKIIYYEFGKITGDKIERRFSIINIDDYLLNSIKEMTDKKRNVVFQTLLTGEKVIAAENFYTEISSFYPNIVATEMESYGIYQAILAYGQDTNFLVVKSIGDWADSTKNDSFQRKASKIASKFVINIIKNLTFTRKEQDCHEV